MYNQIKTVRHSSKEGLFVHFTTEEVVGVGEYFQIILEDKIRFFQVSEIIVDDCVPLMRTVSHVQCKNVGYYNKLTNTQFDARLLIGITVSKVTESDVLKKIREESSYC